MDLEDLADLQGGAIPADFNAEEAPNAEEVGSILFRSSISFHAHVLGVKNLQIEQQFAVVCMEQAEAYWNLITKVKPSTLQRLTKCVLFSERHHLHLKLTESCTCRYDDDIIESFEKAFPELQSDERLKKISEDEMKSPDGKLRWRTFMTPFETIGMLSPPFSFLVKYSYLMVVLRHSVADYNFGTLIRADCEDEYTETNSIFGQFPFSLPRVQAASSLTTSTRHCTQQDYDFSGWQSRSPEIEEDLMTWFGRKLRSHRRIVRDI